MLLASQYHRPPFPDRSRWRDDLAAMRAAGLDALEIWATWAWIEPEPGRFVFDDLDELVEEARRAGLGVIITAVAELNPYWVEAELPDACPVDHLGRRVASSTLSYSPLGVVPGACTDHPGTQRLVGRFLEQLGRRYAGAEHLIAWDAWNEIRWAVESDGHLCFCDHTLAAYRDWLRERHGSLDALNAAWRRRHATWEEIRPGRRPGSGWTETIAFQEFLAWRAAEHLSFRAEHLRAGDPGHQILAHSAVVAPLHTRSENVWEQALARGNEFELAQRVDGFGVSLFPAWFFTSPAESGARIEVTRSACGERSFWIRELQGGAAGHGLRALAPVTADLQQRWVWLSYARGTKAITFWCWRDEVFGRESQGFGIVGSDGHAEERVAALRHTAAVLREHEPLLDAYVPEPAVVGVAFEPLNHQLEWAQSGIEEQASPQSVAGYAVALENMQVPYDVLALSHLGDLSRYRVIHMPWAMVVRPDAAAALASWVEAGGTLVAETELDAFDGQGHYRYAEERPFAERLGLLARGRRPLPSEPVRFAVDGVGGTLPTAGWLDPLAADDAEVLAAAAEGPLVVRRRVGAGEVVAIGTHAGLAYKRERSHDFERLLGALLARAGALPQLRCSEPDGALLQWRLGRSGDELLLFAVNWGPRLEVRFRAASDEQDPFGAATVAHDLLTGRDAPIARDEGPATLAVELDGGGSHVFRFRP